MDSEYRPGDELATKRHDPISILMASWSPITTDLDWRWSGRPNVATVIPSKPDDASRWAEIFSLAEQGANLRDPVGGDVPGELAARCFGAASPRWRQVERQRPDDLCLISPGRTEPVPGEYLARPSPHAITVSYVKEIHRERKDVVDVETVDMGISGETPVSTGRIGSDELGRSCPQSHIPPKAAFVRSDVLLIAPPVIHALSPVPAPVIPRKPAVVRRVVHTSTGLSTRRDELSTRHPRRSGRLETNVTPAWPSSSCLLSTVLTD